MSYVLSKKTVSTAKGVGVSSEKYPKLHLVDVMSDTWYPIPPCLLNNIYSLASSYYLFRSKCGSAALVVPAKQYIFPR